MVTKIVDKPTFTRDQLIPSAVASKNFGKVRKLAQSSPQYITDNGVVDTVVMGYEQFESMYQRLRELEEREEARLLESRLERLEKNPETAVPWRKVQRTGRTDE
ncbi:type II toxin-antitoxin system Phd/YefM family antitoxin [Alicyclobacillaceae bacterium I2511]|nr:type II toxin-antitoxin system Phd/YefM family antitoxin [Alicyclobacillaceae bacterium I2511]